VTQRKRGTMTRAQAAAIARAAIAAKAPPLLERFWAKVDIRGDDECWPWTAAVRNKREGYGAFWLNGRHQPAPRVAMILSGTYIDGMQVCHRCDNPKCCNPKHLFLGTNLDNNQDKVLKGRHAFGSGNGNAKLTDAAVREIRAAKADRNGRRLKPGQLAALAARFGVSEACITDAQSRSWRHV
jgi:hypothetical protein